MPHQYFSESYSKSKITLDSATFDKRQKLVDEVAETCTPQIALDLSRFYLNVEKTEDVVRGHFVKKDKSFPPRDNAQEMRILAGESLAWLLSLGLTPSGNIAALALVTMPDSKREPVEHLRNLAASYLVKQGSDARTLRTLPMANGGGHDAAKLKKPGTPTDTASIAKELVAMFQTISALTDQVRKLSEQNNDLLYNQRILGEESDIGWWLVSKKLGNSEARKLSESHPKGVVVAIALELAFMTQLLPAPVSYGPILQGFLSSLAKDDELLSLGEVRKNLPDGLKTSLARLLDESAGSSLCPYVSDLLSEKTAQDSKKEQSYLIVTKIYLELLLLRATTPGDALGA